MTIRDLEIAWKKQYLHAQQILHSETLKYNQLLTKNNLSARLHSAFIDAANLNLLDDLCNEFNKIFVITEQDLTRLPVNATLCKLPIDFFGCYYTPQIPDNYAIEKDFNCFMNRLDPIRQLWFYQLYNQNLLDRGYVSFNAKLRESMTYPGNTSEEVIESFHQSYMSGFDYIKDKVISNIPFKNFVDNNDLFSITLSTKFSIIIETYFDRSDAIAFSEKTFRALQLPRPWLLFASSGSVSKLRSIGVDVYDDIVDHRYDDFDTDLVSIERQDAILTQATDLVNLKITPALLTRLQHGADHNRKLLSSWYSTWQQSCLNHLQTTFTKAMDHAQ